MDATAHNAPIPSLARPGLIVFDSQSGGAYYAYALVPAGVDAEKARQKVAQRIEQARARYASAPEGQEEVFDWTIEDLARWCKEAGLMLIDEITHGPQWD